MVANTFILLGAILLLLGILASSVSVRLGVPLLLLFLCVGMLAGEDGPGGISFDNFSVSFLVGNLALAVILLDGGLRTRIATFRSALWPAGVLATWGVAVTAGLVGLFATWLLNVDWRYGLLLGAIVGSTDAAAVFNLLRHSGIQLNERVGATLEIESGANDPMAIFLVVLLIEVLTEPAALGAADTVLRLAQQFGFGAVAGVLGGRLLAHAMGRLRLAEGLYALFVASGGMVIFAVVNHIGGSGFLAIYLAGVIVGNRRGRATEHVMRVMDGLAWLAQAGMFLILGLLVTPSHLLQYMAPALAITAFLIVVARPLAVASSLAPFRYPPREIGYVAWVGLRGAVPIVLAIFPTMAGLPESRLLFDVTFVVVLASLLIQGSTVPLMARLLGVLVPRRALPLDSRELWTGRGTSVELVMFRVEPDAQAEGCRLDELHTLPVRDLQCIQVVRETRRMRLEPALALQRGDEVWLLAEPGQTDNIAVFFSRQERQGALALRNFFGEFVINGDAAAADLALAYGLAINDAEADLSIAALIAARLGRPLVVGDSMTLASFRLTVRTMEGNRVLSVGLKLLTEQNGHGR